MQIRGFEETQVSYEAGDPRQLVGSFHRIGPYGPAYEVMAVLNDTRARIVLLETGEEVEYHIADIWTDPHPDDEPPALA